MLAANCCHFQFLFTDQEQFEFIRFSSFFRITIMDVQLNHLTFKISVNLLSDYIKEQNDQLIQIQDNFAQEFCSKDIVDLNSWLIDHSKIINIKITSLFEATKEFFNDAGILFAFEFHQRCFSILQQNNKYLAHALNKTINKSIDTVNYHPLFQQPLSPIITGIEESDRPGKDQITNKNQTFERLSERDLEGLDYFLNLLSYENSKTYEQYKSHCQKLLLQRDIVEKIRPSMASKQIYETTNMIQDAVESIEKAFQSSYILKYMEFKSYISKLQRPESLMDIFKDEMEISTKLKFKEGLNRTFGRLKQIERIDYLQHQVSNGTQTEDSKINKFQQKMQSLLMTERRSNEKLHLQMLQMKRVAAVTEQMKQQISKRLEQQSHKNKELSNKLQHLEHSYNEKCQIVQRITRTQNGYEQKKIGVAVSVQTNETRPKVILTKEYRDDAIQTDVETCQSNVIDQYLKKIEYLQKLIHQKDYIIQQKQAITTFRNNFKSKKQMYSKSTHNISKMPRSFADLDYDGFSSKQEFNKKQVEERTQKNTVLQLKRSKSTRKLLNSKKKLKIDSKVEIDMPNEHKLQRLDSLNTNRLESGPQKVDGTTQTEQIQDDLVIQTKRHVQIRQSSKENMPDKQRVSNRLRSTLRQSQTLAAINSKQHLIKCRDSGEIRDSNFCIFQNLNPKNPMPSNGRPNLFANTQQSIRLTERGKNKSAEKNKYLIKNRYAENKMNTVGHEVFHFNDSLNLHFLDSLSVSHQPKVTAKHLKNKKVQVSNRSKRTQVFMI